jgi:hypothetical protein
MELILIAWLICSLPVAILIGHCALGEECEVRLASPSRPHRLRDDGDALEVVII